jgi:hypothetical protein
VKTAFGNYGYSVCSVQRNGTSPVQHVIIKAEGQVEKKEIYSVQSGWGSISGRGWDFLSPLLLPDRL